MRFFMVSVLLLASTASAQSRWSVSTGPEWSGAGVFHTWGVRLRAEYDLLKPNRALAVRLESAARWGPTQTYFSSGFGNSIRGTEQRLDLVLGLNASLSPLPRARVSPYITAGVYARQEWLTASQFASNGNQFSSTPLHTVMSGNLAGALGIGVRMRLGRRTFQVEYRRFYNQTGVTFGTRLPL